MKNHQLQLLAKSAFEHGGSIRKGKRKIARPICTKRAMHVVLRAKRAKGRWSMLNNRCRGLVNLIALELAEKHGVKIYGFENVGNHIHILLKTRTRRGLQNFLRIFTQKIMFLVTGARKGSPQGKFWDALAYSRIVEWGNSYLRVKKYFAKNLREALGLQRIYKKMSPLPP